MLWSMNLLSISSFNPKEKLKSIPFLGLKADGIFWDHKLENSFIVGLASGLHGREKKRRRGKRRRYPVSAKPDSLLLNSGHEGNSWMQPHWSFRVPGPGISFYDKRETFLWEILGWHMPSRSEKKSLKARRL